MKLISREETDTKLEYDTNAVTCAMKQTAKEWKPSWSCEEMCVWSGVLIYTLSQLLF